MLLQGELQGKARSRLGSAMKAVRRRAAGAQILMTEHVEQLWLTGYKCVPAASARQCWVASLEPCFRTRNLCKSRCCTAEASAVQHGRRCRCIHFIS